MQATANSHDPVPAGAPTRLAIPSIGVDRIVRTLPESSCPVVNPPTLLDPYWLECRAAPGTDSRGTTFLAGHSVVNGVGVFDNLGDATVGDRIDLWNANGKLTYQVSSVHSFGRHGEVQRAAVMRQNVPGRLLIVTCRLMPDGGLTDDNLVVEAELVASSRR